MKNKYNDYTIEISLKSPIITQFQADTIFGHICWAIRYLFGETSGKVEDFLNHYDRGKKPPLLLSNGFLKGTLPKPILGPLSQEDLESVVGINNRVENSFKLKTIKKFELITKECLLALQQTILSPRNLFKIMYDKYENIVVLINKHQTCIIQHNTINRADGSVKSGGLFSQHELFYDPISKNGSIYEIYIRTYYFNRRDLQNLFSYIGEEGFGKDKSTGRGHFSFKIKDGIDLIESKEPNAFITLSSYIPKEDDPIKGHYTILHKYGKLGDIYAKGSTEVGNNPFKKPLMMFGAGSVFFDENYHPEKIYGSLLNNIHHNTKIRHYAYAFPMGIRVEEANG